MIFLDPLLDEVVSIHDRIASGSSQFVISEGNDFYGSASALLNFYSPAGSLGLQIATDTAGAQTFISAPAGRFIAINAESDYSFAPGYREAFVEIDAGVGVHTTLVATQDGVGTSQIGAYADRILFSPNAGEIEIDDGGADSFGITDYFGDVSHLKSARLDAFYTGADVVLSIDAIYNVAAAAKRTFFQAQAGTSQHFAQIITDKAGGTGVNVYFSPENLTSEVAPSIGDLRCELVVRSPVAVGFIGIDSTGRFVGGRPTGGSNRSWGFLSSLGDSSTTISYSFDTLATLSTSGALHSKWLNNTAELGRLDKDGVLTMKKLRMSDTSSQLVFQSSGVTGTISWAPATSNKTITLPNGTTDFTATGGTAQFLKQSSAGAAITVGAISSSDLPALGGNPSQTIGLSAVNGSATTYLRSDGAPALSQAITPTWTNVHTFSARPVFNGGIDMGVGTAETFRTTASGGDIAFTAARFTSNVPTASTQAQFYFKPNLGNTTQSDFIFLVSHQDNSPIFAIHQDKSITFNQTGIVGGYITIGDTITAYPTGVNFIPTIDNAGNSYFSGTYTANVGARFRCGCAATPNAPTLVGGLFAASVPSSLTADMTALWGGWFAATETTSGSNSTRTWTEYGGFKVFGLQSAMNMGTATNWYGGYIQNSIRAAASAGQVVVNAYGIYYEEQTRATTINNGAFFACATSTYKAIAIRDQNAWISSDAASELSLHAATALKSYIGANAETSLAAGFLTFKDGSTLTPTTNGGSDIGANGLGWNAQWFKDTSAAFEDKIIFTSSTALSADRILTVDMENAARTLLLGQATGRSTAQTAAVASVATLTVGAADATYMVSANVLVTTATLHNFTVTVAYTDEGNTARTLTLNFSLLAGTLGTAIANAAGAVPYEGVPLQIRCKASTAITIATTGTFTTCTYNVEGFIKRIT